MTSKYRIILCYLSLHLLIQLALTQTLSAPQLSTFTGITGSNVYLLTNSFNYLLVESGGYGDATAVLAFLAANNVPNIDLIFITHGHPDHYGGTGQITAQFPTAVVGVGSQSIKDELVANAAENGITDYDFANNVQVLVSNGVLGTFNLEIINNFLEGESEYAAALYNARDNYIFGGDILYVNSHMYLGPTLDPFRVYNWISINLPSFATNGRLGLKKSHRHLSWSWCCC